MAIRLLTTALLDWLQHRPEARRRRAIIAAFLMVILAVFGIRGSATAAAESITVALPAARIAGVSAPRQEAALASVGSAGKAEAEQLNASVPIDSSGLQPAKPFFLTGSPEQQQQALTCLSQAVYYEAGSEPVEGRRAVAQVVLNRVRHVAFPHSVCGVVYQKNATGVCQFTFVCDGALDRPPVPGAWREAEEIARAALHGSVEPSVGDATHYHADYVAPPWAPLLQKLAVVGQHIFYRWPGPAGDEGAFSARYAGEGTDAVPGAKDQGPASTPRVRYDLDALLASAPAQGVAAAD